MTVMGELRSAFEKALHKAQPILVHVLSGAILVVSFTAFGVLLVGLEAILPSEHEVWEFLKFADAICVGVSFLYLGLYTLIVLPIRLARSIGSELDGGDSK